MGVVWNLHADHREPALVDLERLADAGVDDGFLGHARHAGDRVGARNVRSPESNAPCLRCGRLGGAWREGARGIVPVI